MSFDTLISKKEFCNEKWLVIYKTYMNNLHFVIFCFYLGYISMVQQRVSLISIWFIHFLQHHLYCFSVFAIISYCIFLYKLGRGNHDCAVCRTGNFWPSFAICLLFRYYAPEYDLKPCEVKFFSLWKLDFSGEVLWILLTSTILRNSPILQLYSDIDSSWLHFNYYLKNNRKFISRCIMIMK